MADSPPSRRRVVVVPGDDAAPEAMRASLRVLAALDLPLELDVAPAGVELVELPMEERERLLHSRIDLADTVLFGSSNGTTPGLVYLRWGKLTYANCRPIKWRPGFRSPLARPEGIDYVIVRENLEDAYVGVMGNADDLRASGLIGPRSRVPEGDGRFAAKVVTRAGTERVARFACDLTRSRKAAGHRGRLTVSAKTNMLPATDRYFCDIAREVAQDYPDIEYEQYIVDDMAHRLVVRPHDLDVVLLPNLYGDILSDEAAGTIGGMGLAASGCYGDGYAYFESAHGTAPDIAGHGLINPTATLLSAEMLLRHLDLTVAADRLDAAISEVYMTGAAIPPDQGGTADTEAFADAVVAALSL